MVPIVPNPFDDTEYRTFREFLSTHQHFKPIQRFKAVIQYLSESLR